VVKVGFKVKQITFNRRAVMNAKDRGQKKYLRHAGGYLRKVARNSLGRRYTKKSDTNLKDPNWKLEIGGHGPMQASGNHFAVLVSNRQVERAKEMAARRPNVPERWLRKHGLSRKKSARPSPPGQPPKSAGRLRKSILYAVQSDSVIIGPTANVIGQVGAVHEFGERFRDAKYPARPYMGPALEKTKPKLAAMWRDSVT
jgi:phage gpG-like protein